MNVQAKRKLPVKLDAACPDTVRTGRPPRDRAGEVDARILAAAHQAFLEHGLAGARMEAIAARARAGKPTIYARYPDKEALFVAVVLRNVARVTSIETHVPAGADLEERLIDLGVTFLRGALVADTVGLMRLVISEATRFPDLAGSVHQMAHERGVQAGMRLLTEATQTDDTTGALPAFSPPRLATTARFFFDLVFWPPLKHALFGEKLKTLRAGIRPHVASSVAFFLAACRSDKTP